MLEEWLAELGCTISTDRETQILGIAYDNDVVIRYSWEWLQLSAKHTFDRWAGHTISSDNRIQEEVGVEIILPTDFETLTKLIHHWRKTNRRFRKEFPDLE